MDTSAVLVEPTRRRILDALRSSERSVGELAESLAVSQPTMSKHLKVLLGGGLVSCRIAAQVRIYRIEPELFLLGGQSVEPIRGQNAMNHGWQELHDAYAERLGVASTSS